MRFGCGVCPKAVKLAVLLVGIGFVFSFNAFAVGNAIKCTSENNLQGYRQLHELKKSSSNKIGIYYSLAITSLCIGKEAEGMSHLQKASDMGHVDAIHLLGMYYNTNKTFDLSKNADSPENWNATVHYYEKAAATIEGISNYPDEVMEFHERVGQTSYYVFVSLPTLYFNGYTVAIGEILNSVERMSYIDTLEVLHKMRNAAIRCLERPALSIWKKKKALVYEAQQIKCLASLKFVEAAFLLEQQRIRVAQNCPVVPLRKCSEHQQVVNEIGKFVQKMREEEKSAPKF